jgi:uncharacterized protein (TIGR02246 family)
MHPDEPAIRDLVQTWMKASAAGDLDQVLALMSDDVIFHTPAGEPFGKKEFAEASRASAGKVRAEGAADVVEVQISGDMGYCRVRLDIRLTTQEGAEVNRLTGYSMPILRKQGGRWVLTRDANFVAPAMRQAVTTQLMFDGCADEAMRLYVSLFRGSEVKRVEKYGPGEQGKEGTVKRAEVHLSLRGLRRGGVRPRLRHAL